MVDAVRGYVIVAGAWIRATMAYRASFWMIAVGSFFLTGLDFVGIWILFRSVEEMGGFSLQEVAFLYGASGLGMAFADLFVGRVERLGQMIRMGNLDTMMVRPVVNLRTAARVLRKASALCPKST